MLLFVKTKWCCAEVNRVKKLPIILQCAKLNTHSSILGSQGLYPLCFQTYSWEGASIKMQSFTALLVFMLMMYTMKILVFNRKCKINRRVTFWGDDVFSKSKRLPLTWKGFLTVFYFWVHAAKLDSKIEKTSDTKG